MNIGELANTSGSILERISEKALTIPNNCAFHAEALPNDKFDVLFEDGTSLLSLLPEGVRFAQTTSNIPSANVGWKKDGTVELMEIVGNPSLVAKEHPQYLSLFSHEIGHVLALFEEAKFWANPDIAPKSETETLADLYQNIQFSLYAGSLAWKVELEAWNHGKVVYQLFRAPEEVFQGVMQLGIDSYTTVQSGQMLREIEEYLYKFGRSAKDIDPKKEFDIYDPTAQDYTKVGFSELMGTLVRLSQREQAHE
ncbi:MAG: hypothetical protein UX79_C0017G0002 [candidate division WWE3 bacterium GW2011_GWB1_47_11]|uniref:Uncharacterized protein n=1 Tax=candidate division WWE3 bacterium GW2011_GWB1_47_11 TaxID=1619117 RepID=A0A0G1TSW4_UNCKA|nr:MAG: hypothetical protein UX79_C0017G0002 [candidate division WWE3 bacterium GW2011_GWB1_47_11]